MKLVFIYGPPAVGKLTVARELAKITGYKILHNHVTIDILEQFIEFGTNKFWDYNAKIKREILKVVIKEDINLIYTWSYAKDVHKNLNKVLRLLRKNKIKMFFVHITCDQRELYKRVKQESRKKFGKLKHTNKLKPYLKKWDFYSPISFVESFSINNTDLSAKKVAQQIKKHFKL